MKHFIVGTAGHVDHGKSSLVKALTGTDPDRLPEEKARQITIDLGFAELSLGEGIHAGIIDVPGHEDFVRNMVAGVGSIDLALLVIAADDGWMPQTEEHVQILEYLGVSKAVVALTKCDAGNAATAEEDVRNQLGQTTFAAAPIVTCSARTGEGLEELRDVIVAKLSQLPGAPDANKARLAVDRAFTLRGIGTVITGTLTGGCIARTDSVWVQPRGQIARIRSIESHGRATHIAYPGTRTALNLPELTAAADIRRGDVITTGEFRPTDIIDVNVTRSARLQRAAPLKSGTTVYVHHATSRTAARILSLGPNALTAGESSLAQLRLSSPILAFIGDRFIIRDSSEQHTLGGGVVLNVRGDSKKTRDHKYRDWLTHRHRTVTDVEACLKSELALRHYSKVADLLCESHFSAAEISAALERLRQKGELVLAAGFVVDTAVWADASTRSVELIDQTHKERPERPGVEITAVRASLTMLPTALIEGVIDSLCSGDFVRSVSTVRRASHQAAVSGNVRNIAVDIKKALEEHPNDPPSRKQIETDEVHRTALRYLITAGEVTEISPEIAFSSRAVAEIRRRIITFINDRGAATVSELRQEIGTSRRVLVPLLEWFDRHGVTRRVGDKRMLARLAQDGKMRDAQQAHQ